MIRQEIEADKGVTLIELMIVLVIAGIVIGAIYTIFATQQRSYYVQDRVTGIQQDARAADLEQPVAHLRHEFGLATGRSPEIEPAAADALQRLDVAALVVP